MRQHDVTKGTQKANRKSMMGVMMMEASQNSELTTLIHERFGEAEEPIPYLFSCDLDERARLPGAMLRRLTRAFFKPKSVCNGPESA